MSIYRIVTAAPDVTGVLDGDALSPADVGTGEGRTHLKKKKRQF